MKNQTPKTARKFGPLKVQITTQTGPLPTIKLSARRHRRLALYAEENGVPLEKMIEIACEFLTEGSNFARDISPPAVLEAEDEKLIPNRRTLRLVTV